MFMQTRLGKPVCPNKWFLCVVHEKLNIVYDITTLLTSLASPDDLSEVWWSDERSSIVSGLPGELLGDRTGLQEGVNLTYK